MQKSAIKNSVNTALTQLFWGIKQWLYRGKRPNWIAKMLNRGIANSASKSISPDGVVALEVIGRKSGQIVSLSGTIMTNDPVEGDIPTFGAIPATNLTSGNGGVAKTYTDADWIRAIRHGVKPDGQVEIYMYEYFSNMSDQDLGDLISYLKQIAPVDSDTPAMHYGPIVPIFTAIGIFTPAAELIDHNASPHADPVAGTTKEYGRYLSAICAGCHGNSVGMKFEKWSEGDFIRVNKG
jgi:cytochrome c553